MFIKDLKTLGFELYLIGLTQRRIRVDICFSVWDN